MIARSAEPVAPVAGGREGDSELGRDDVRLPPVQFDQATGAEAGEQGLAGMFHTQPDQMHFTRARSPAHSHRVDKVLGSNGA